MCCNFPLVRCSFAVNDPENLNSDDNEEFAQLRTISVNIVSYDPEIRRQHIFCKCTKK